MIATFCYQNFTFHHVQYVSGRIYHIFFVEFCQDDALNGNASIHCNMSTLTQVQRVRLLYKGILRLHRSLPKPMKEIGDGQV